MWNLDEDSKVREFFKEWVDKGRAEGSVGTARSSLLKVLSARSFLVTPEMRARIDNEADVTRLMSWVETAVIAASIDDVFR